MKQKSSDSETDRIFQAIFHRSDVSEVLRERFASASVVLESQFDRDDVETARFALAEVGDLEALEFAARIRSGLPVLIQKFTLMIILSECEPQYRPHFVGSRDRRLHAWLSIAWHSARSAYKLIKGLILLKLLAMSTKSGGSGG